MIVPMSTQLLVHGARLLDCGAILTQVQSHPRISVVTGAALKRPTRGHTGV